MQRRSGQSSRTLGSRRAGAGASHCGIKCKKPLSWYKLCNRNRFPDELNFRNARSEKPLGSLWRCRKSSSSTQSERRAGETLRCSLSPRSARVRRNPMSNSPTKSAREGKEEREEKMPRKLRGAPGFIALSRAAREGVCRGTAPFLWRHAGRNHTQETTFAVQSVPGMRVDAALGARDSELAVRVAEIVRRSGDT
eukprot:3144165-Rhodomonas_salina.1